jgi:hypothetical protein
VSNRTTSFVEEKNDIGVNRLPRRIRVKFRGNYRLDMGNHEEDTKIYRCVMGDVH